ncbi:MAG: STAS domain-containing protein [Chloroflexus sp.]|uniref:STAS domain-containing protein n=1 Tax=Chloroflexus sp. TaxID=1904827 RepID=UPI0030A94628
MLNPVRNLLNVHHPDEEVRQRGRNIIIIALGLLCVNLLVAISLLFNVSQATRLFATSMVGVILYVFVIVIAFKGFVELAGWLTVIISLFGTISSILINPDRPVAIFLSVSLVLAATILSLRSLIIVFFLTACSLVGIAFFLEPIPLNLTARDFLIPVGVLCGFLSVISFVQSAGNEALHRRLQAALQRAKQAANQLQLLNDELDRRVDAQTEALQEAMSELEARAAQQDRLLAEVIAQRDVIRRLSVPVLPAGTDLLAIPLVGTIDQERLATIQQQALTAVEQRRARWLILDVTGVPFIDTGVAGGLIQLIQSVRLLGAEVVLVGVRPEVAQTMVSLGIELPVTYVYSDLAGAIEDLHHRTNHARQNNRR